MLVVLFPLSSKIKSSPDCQDVPPPGLLGELVLTSLEAELSFITVIMNGSTFTSLGANSGAPLAKTSPKGGVWWKYTENAQLFVL